MPTSIGYVPSNDEIKEWNQSAVEAQKINRQQIQAYSVRVRQLEYESDGEQYIDEQDIDEKYEELKEPKRVVKNFMAPKSAEAKNAKKPYMNVKNSFEKFIFLCEDESCYYDTRGNEPIIRKEHDLTAVYKNKVYDDVNKDGKPIKEQFFYKWIMDPNKKTYKSVSLILPPLVCPKNTYNLWKGFAITLNYITEYSRKDLRLWKSHLLMLCNEDEASYEYLLNWIAHLFQKPAIKPGVMIMIKSRQGLGKELGLYKPLKRMIGDAYCSLVDNIERDVLGDFNSTTKNKLLIGLDEMNIRTSLQFEDKIKSLITRSIDSTTAKGRDTRDTPSYTRYISFSNNSFPWKVSHDDRRSMVIDASSQPIPTRTYLDRLALATENAGVLRSFYDEMKSRNIENWHPSKDIPKTEFLEDLKSLSVPIETRFMIDLLEDVIMSRNSESVISCEELYDKYCCFATEQRVEKPLSKRAFGIKIKGLRINGMSSLQKGEKRQRCHEFKMIPVLEWLIENNYTDIPLSYLQPLNV